MNDVPQTSDHPLPGPAARSHLPPSMPVVADRRPGVPSWAWGVVLLAIVLSLASVALVWRTQQRVKGIEQELVRRQQDSASQATEARVLSKAAEDASREASAKVALLEARFAEVSLQRGQLDDVIQQLTRSRDDNVVADLESAIRVAMQQSLITGSAEPLVATLQQADERLARANQPRLDGVRRAIARDLDKARSAGTVNISTLSIKLDEAARLVDELPLVSSVAGSEARGGAGAAPVLASSSAPRQGPRGGSSPANVAAPHWTQGWIDGWRDFWSQVWTEARGLVRVTRIDHPESMLVAPENAFFLRENLKLRLLNARLAVLSRQFDTAQADLQTVQATLERYFDRNSRKVAVAIDNVRQVAAQARQIVLPRPDDTLAALTALSVTR